jgi:NADH-quinone oxidoreductase subunit J
MSTQDVGVASAFWALAIVGVGSALAVVLLRDLFRAAIFLVMAFLSVAGLYVLLEADFLAAAQVLIYAGAIAILLIFAIMMTREVQTGGLFHKYSVPVLFLAVLFLATLILVVVNTDWTVATQAPPESTTEAIGDALFSRFVLPFEIAAALLLAAIIGAITLGRER